MGEGGATCLRGSCILHFLWDGDDDCGGGGGEDCVGDDDADRDDSGNVCFIYDVHSTSRWEGGAICLRGSCIFYDGNHDEYDSGPHKGAVCPLHAIQT